MGEILIIVTHIGDPDVLKWMTRRSGFEPRQRQKSSFSPTSEAHPASCPMGTGGPFPLAKARPRRDADHSPLSSAEVKMSKSYTSSTPKRLHGV
jgi:hypothetical protein